MNSNIDTLNIVSGSTQFLPANPGRKALTVSIAGSSSTWIWFGTKPQAAVTGFLLNTGTTTYAFNEDNIGPMIQQPVFARTGAAAVITWIEVTV